MWILDGIALIQSLKSVPKAVSELANSVLQLLFLLTLSENKTGIGFIMDQYPEVSIKNPERAKHTVVLEGLSQLRSKMESRSDPVSGRKFLGDDSNNTQLSNFFFREWQKEQHAPNL